MRKKYNSYILLSLLICLSHIGYAQKPPKFERGSDISASIGYLPITTIYDSFLYDGCKSIYQPNSLSGIFSDGDVWLKDAYITGAINLTYTRRLKNWLEFSTTMSYMGYYSHYYNNIDNSFAYSNNSHNISFIPEARFIWLRARSIKLYTSIGIGVSYYSDESRLNTDTNVDRGIGIAAKFTPLGMRVGARKLYGFGEFSAGSTGFFLVGIGYKIN